MPVPAVFALREEVLGLFGPHYVAAGAPFLILVLMPLASALLGPVTLILNILGHRRELLLGCLAGGIAMALATPLGGWLDGVRGAATGATAAFVLQQGLLYVMARRRTGIDPSVLGALGHLLGRRAALAPAPR